MEFMMKKAYVLWFFGLYFCVLHNAQDGGQKLKDQVKTITDTAKATWDGAGTMLKAMRQGFGIVTKDYYYNYRVFNDSYASLFVAEERLTGILGATFTGKIVASSVLNPMVNQEFSKSQLYIRISLCPADRKDELDKYQVLKKAIYPWQPNDNNVYFYRAYTSVENQKPVMKGETLGLMGMTSEFSGQFYNSSNQDVILSFSKDNLQYAVTLESNSFSLLESSTKTNSIRPPSGGLRWFQFYKKKPLSSENAFVAVPIANEGIAYMEDISQEGGKPNYVVSSPALYSYKLYNSSVQKSGLDVAMQGLAIGNFDQPVSGNIRDINPVNCHLWYMSAAQAKTMQKNQTDQQKSDYSATPFDLPEQVWVTYKTTDYTYQQKIAPGTIIDFTLIRPQLKEKIASLYVVSLQTDDDMKAKQFLDRLNAGIIGQNVFYTRATFDEKNILTNITPTLNGIIDDTQGAGGSGIRGFVILADQYLPQGLGDGPYYYSIESSDLSINQFANSIWFDEQFYTKDSSGASVLSNEVMKNLSETLPQWIVQYRTDRQAATTALRNYFLASANKVLFIDATVSPAQRTLTAQGEALLQALTSGPISLQNYPIIRKSGINDYVMSFGAKPGNWLS